jgi:hypothetical protein
MVDRVPDWLVKLHNVYLRLLRVVDRRTWHHNSDNGVFLVFAEI